MNTAVGIGIGIAYGTRVTGNYNPGFSLTAPVLTQNPVVTNDATPDFDVALTLPEVGDVITLQWSMFSDFSVIAGSDTNTVDSSEASALLVTFTTGTLADGPWKFRAMHSRGGSNSAWSTTCSVTVELAVPTLSSPTDIKTGASTGTGTVSTDEFGGTLYWVLSSASNTPTAAQIVSGQDHTGAAAAKSGSQAVTATGVQTVPFTALAANTLYYANYCHRDQAPQNSAASHADGFTTDADTTAPVLSSPVDASASSTTGTGSVTTDEANGTLYWVVTTSATSPTKAQVKAGQNHAGAAATDSGSQAVSATGAQAVTGDFTGLTASTQYYAHYMHEDAATNQSDVSSANGFTTDADVTAPTLSSPVDTAATSTTGTGSVSTNEGNGTLYWVVSTSSTAPSAAQVKAGQMHTGAAAADSGSQAVSGTGVQSISGDFTGLTASTAYTAHYMHEDAAANQSAVSSGDGFTTSANATMWNSADKAANTTLSNNDLTITKDAGAASFRAVRAVASKSTGKYYYEVTAGPFTAAGGTTIGIANSTQVLTSFIGNATHGIGVNTNDQVLLNSNNVGSATAWGNGNVIDVAIDLDNGMGWWRVDGGNWNNSATADPATNTEGEPLSGLSGGPYYPAANLYTASDTLTANFGASAYTYSAPSGFSNWS